MKIYNYNGNKVLYIPVNFTNPIQTTIYHDQLGGLRKITLRINGELYFSKHVAAQNLEKEVETLQRNIEELLDKISEHDANLKVQICEDGKFIYL